MAKFENVFKPIHRPCPLVVIDFNVHLFGVREWFEKNVLGRFEPEVEKKLLRACWAARINRGPEMLKHHSNYRFVVIADARRKTTNNYWRDEFKKEEVNKAWLAYAEEKNLDLSEMQISYKGNRGEKDDLFYRIFYEGRDYCTKYFSFFSEEGYEADDFAGAIYRISRDNPGSVANERQILLSTIDRDWSQLVDDEQKIYFANTRKPRPNEKIQERLCGNRGVIEHTAHRMGYELDHPRNLSHWKEIHGDLGDNLPPKAPRELFDLCEPNPNFNVDELPQISELVKTMNNPRPNSRKTHYEAALNAFSTCLLEHPVEPG